MRDTGSEDGVGVAARIMGSVKLEDGFAAAEARILGGGGDFTVKLTGKSTFISIMIGSFIFSLFF
jgi:hypothetical protein